MTTRQPYRADVEVALDKAHHMSASTKTTYASSLANLYRVHRHNDDESFHEFTRRPAKDLIALVRNSDRPDQSKRLLISALKVCVPAKDEELFSAEIRRYKGLVDKNYEDQKSKPKSSLTMDEVEDIFEELRAKVHADKKNLEKWTDLIMCALTSGLFVSCRRIQDWQRMVTRGPQEGDKCNYYADGKFIFHVYKTAKFETEPQVVDCPKDLQRLLDRWVKIKSPNDYMLFQSNGRMFTASAFTKRMHQIFGPGNSVSTLRSVYASAEMGDDLAEMNRLKSRLEAKAEAMGSSVSMMDQVYVRGKAEKKN